MRASSESGARGLLQFSQVGRSSSMMRTTDSDGRAGIGEPDTWIAIRRVGRRKHPGEREGVGTFTVFAQMREALLGFVDRRNVTGGYPPQRKIRPIEALEPRL